MQHGARPTELATWCRAASGAPHTHFQGWPQSAARLTFSKAAKTHKTRLSAWATSDRQNATHPIPCAHIAMWWRCERSIIGCGSEFGLIAKTSPSDKFLGQTVRHNICASRNPLFCYHFLSERFENHNHKPRSEESSSFDISFAHPVLHDAVIRRGSCSFRILACADAVRAACSNRRAASRRSRVIGRMRSALLALPHE